MQADDLAQDGGSIMLSLERCPDFGELPVLEGHCRGAVVQIRAGRLIGPSLGWTAWLSRCVYDIGSDAWRSFSHVCDVKPLPARACTRQALAVPERNKRSALVLAATVPYTGGRHGGVEVGQHDALCLHVVGLEIPRLSSRQAATDASMQCLF